MDFKKLQTMQRDLDQTILDSKPEMTKEERFTKTLVALSVELAEVANCAEHFKFWKDNKGKVDEKTFYCISQTVRPGVEKPQKWCRLDNQEKIMTREQAHKPTLVEECADALHFVLSLANQLDMDIEEQFFLYQKFGLAKEFFYMKAQHNISVLCNSTIVSDRNTINIDSYFKNVITNYLNYIYVLGISHEELEQAYYDKHEVNYKRQEEGY